MRLAATDAREASRFPPLEKPLTVFPPGNSQERCHMVLAKGFAQERYQHCVRPYPDAVSGSISGSGHWSDCNVLTTLWDAPSYASNQAKATEPKFLEVGANVGACTAPMLSKGVRTVAFEPAAPNLFYLTSTIISNPGFDQRVDVFPYAASDKVDEQTIHIARGNAGNAVVGKPIADFAGQQFDEIKIKTIRLDDVLWPDPESPPPHFKVLKIDAQGYEMHVLAGAPRLFRAGCIGIIKLEVADNWLEGHGTNAKDFLTELNNLGFDIYEDAVIGDIFVPRDVRKIEPYQYGIHNRGVYDLIAVRRK